MPGNVFAIGLLIPLAGLDSGMDDLMRSLFGISTGLLLSGTALAVVLAYTIPFLAASLGAVESGLSRISRKYRCRRAHAWVVGERVAGQGPYTDAEASTWCRSASHIRRFDEGAAGELLLRPFNFDTLATRVFTLVSLYRLGESWFVRAHDRACEPRPSPSAARHHCPKSAGSLGEPFCRT